jgi:ubiquinone/menaquinone biosynthesis C-methylase UbiE
MCCCLRWAPSFAELCGGTYMKLNKLEFMAMNNPVRAFVQEKYELKILRAMTSLKGIESVLEIGCGNGTGTKLIKKYFAPKNITAIDLDEKMIEIARERTTDPSISFTRMDASKLDFPDEQFDAIFDFGIIHHVPDWKGCLQELKRVLKPTGQLILEDLSIDSFTIGIGKLWRIVSAHPYDSMYTPKEFTEYMKNLDFKIIHYQESNPLKFIRFFSLNAVLQ